MFKQIALAVGASWSLFYLYAWAHNNFKTTFMIERKIEISDTAENVFAFILNKKNYPLGMVKSWTGIEPEKEFQKIMNGENKSTFKVGETKFKVDLITLGELEMTLSHWMVDRDTKKHFKFGWVGTSIHERNFRGDHQFEIIAKGNDKCELIHREDISGISTPLARLFHEWTGYIHYYSKYLEEVKTQIHPNI